MLCGIVDLGSNTIRLSIYHCEGKEYRLLMHKKTMAGLAGYVQDGVLSDSGVERYAFGNLEDFTGETFRIDRVCWLEGTVTIPAGGSLTVTAEMTKSPSFDYACTRTENRGIYGYDMVTALGSQLTFTGQEAVIEDRGLVEIAFQNFGFDLETGVRRVALDVGQDHYYLGVQRRT